MRGKKKGRNHAVVQSFLIERVELRIGRHRRNSAAALSSSSSTSSGVGMRRRITEATVTAFVSVAREIKIANKMGTHLQFGASRINEGLFLDL
jgi:hypothetical protein